MILDIAIIAWATVLSLWPRGTWAVVGQPPSQPSMELLGTGAPEAALLLPSASCLLQTHLEILTEE